MITEEVFSRSRPDFNKLQSAGFHEEGGVFRCAEVLPGEQFRAELEVAEDGKVTGHVIDLDTGEEYLPLRIEGQTGGFVGQVREDYRIFLERVRDACFIPVSFIYDQSNRIEGRIHRDYSVTAEFPWEKYPGNGTFKCRENGKWFGAILTVAHGKLAGEAHSSAHDEDEVVEVVNLKASPDEIPALTNQPGIFPAWHMNKKHWISVILDDTLSDEAVMELIRGSHALTSKGKGNTAGSGPRAAGVWMIPSNPAYYDVDAGFRGGKGEIEWHQHTKVKSGDEVYIYCSAPYSAILYRCKVVAADLPYRGMFKESKGYTKSMRIRLIEKYPQDKYPLAFLKAHGGSAVRSARSMPAALYEAICKAR